jgi:hypothetical protein
VHYNHSSIRYTGTGNMICTIEHVTLNLLVWILIAFLAFSVYKQMITYGLLLTTCIVGSGRDKGHDMCSVQGRRKETYLGSLWPFLPL